MKIIKALMLFLMILTVSAPSYALEVSTYNDLNTFEKDFANDKDPKILFLFASWCSACKSTFPVLPKIAENTDYKVYALSLDKNLDALKKYVDKYQVKEASPNHKGALKVLYLDKDIALKDITNKLKDMGLEFKGVIPFVVVYKKDGKVDQQGKVDLVEMYNDGKLK